MLKLKYLHDNRELAKEILGRWHYDEEGLKHFDRYRISSNAIYPFTAQGDFQLLRFSPNQEKSPEYIKGELDFLRYLRENAYPVPDTILSQKGRELEVCQTPWGEYSAVVFSCVPGKRMDGITLTDTIIKGYGASLGRLHKLSSAYKPLQNKRHNHEQQLDYMSSMAEMLDMPSCIAENIEKLREGLSALEITKGNYGLIHYDYELDNVLWEEEKNRFYVIDFDDSVYHFYTMDIIICIDNILEEHPEMDREHVEACLLDGYQQEYPIENKLMAHRELFKLYEHVYSYIRCQVSLSETGHEKPEWMLQLITKLERYCDNTIKVLIMG